MLTSADQMTSLKSNPKGPNLCIPLLEWFLHRYLRIIGLSQFLVLSIFVLNPATWPCTGLKAAV